ncbi:MAG: TatD family hydrolase [Candidatus Peregrinibacteria bacterium GW2011_GWA2_47_7]|nr:MAG: TatD family hydrolase [Candidatus Peregrinibacteria bacterium GW2011_GWA2_47_7]
MLIDIHAHLHVKDFDADRDSVITRALQAGVLKMINVGFDAEGNFHALNLAKKYDFIWCTMGIHPHLASEWNEYVAKQIESAVKKEERIVALGEMGLDYFKNFQPPELQKKAFQEQLRLARKLDLPVIIHCRDAFEDCLKLIQEEEITKAVFHCFTGNLPVAKRLWEKGFYTSFTGIITYATAHELREVVTAVPEELFFIETDCPYLAPQKYRGQRNEPAYLREVAETIAAVKKMDLKEVEKNVERNVRGLFGI